MKRVEWIMKCKGMPLSYNSTTIFWVDEKVSPVAFRMLIPVSIRAAIPVCIPDDVTHLPSIFVTCYKINDNQ